jgi:hypothetical protein
MSHSILSVDLDYQVEEEHHRQQRTEDLDGEHDQLLGASPRLAEGPGYITAASISV